MSRRARPGGPPRRRSGSGRPQPRGCSRSLGLSPAAGRCGSRRNRARSASRRREGCGRASRCRGGAVRRGALARSGRSRGLCDGARRGGGAPPGAGRHRPWSGQPQLPGDHVRPHALRAPQLFNLRYQARRCEAGRAPGLRGAVLHCERPFAPASAHPLGDRRPRDAEPAGHFGLRPPGLNLRDQFGASRGSQPCVRMGEEGPPVTAGFVHHNATARPLFCQQPLMGTAAKVRALRTQGRGGRVMQRSQLP